MKLINTSLQDAFIIRPKLFEDSRGLFFEAWNKENFNRETNLNISFVQENQSISRFGVLRGLHYQLKNPQGKLVRVSHGKVLDVIVDLRKSSDTYGKHFSIELSAESNTQLWIPPGMAHGFLTLSDHTIFNYLTTSYYDSSDEHTIIWNDNFLNIDWTYKDIIPKLSSKDKIGKTFEDSEHYD